MTDREARFWDRIADRYAASPVADQAGYEHKLALTRRYLQPAMSAVEFGCGTGSTALQHAPLVGSYLASDVAPRMIEIARGKLAERPVAGLEFRVSTLEGLVLADASQDIVLGLNILHLLGDIPGTIAEAARVLKPGGVFVTSTACLRDRLYWFRPLVFIGHALHLAPRVQFIRKSGLVAMIKAAGFEVVEQWQPSAKSPMLFLIARRQVGL